MKWTHRNFSLPFLIAALQPMPAIAQGSSFDDFCATFRSVHATAFRGFKPWRGASEESDPESFSTTVKFPGASMCDISDNEYNHQFTCYWSYGFDEEERSTDDAINLAQAIRKCLNHLEIKDPRSRAQSTSSNGTIFLWRDKVEGEIDHVSTSVYVMQRGRYTTGSGREIAAKISLGMQISVDKY